LTASAIPSTLKAWLTLPAVPVAPPLACRSVSASGSVKTAAVRPIVG
jgi:hypothetical protein